MLRCDPIPENASYKGRIVLPPSVPPGVCGFDVLADNWDSMKQRHMHAHSFQRLFESSRIFPFSGNLLPEAGAVAVIWRHYEKGPPDQSAMRYFNRAPPRIAVYAAGLDSETCKFTLRA
jgi:hypothetical protein